MLKGNEHIRGALVMGILQVAKAGLLSGMNNLMVFPMDVDMYSKACMFTEDETRKLYDQEAELRGDENALSFSYGDLKGWYNGYYASDSTRLYNPWSIDKAFTTGNLGSYWVESGYDRMVQERIHHFLDTDNRFRAQIADLLANNSTDIEIEEDMSYHSVADMSPTQLWTLIYYAGYLTKMPLDSTVHDVGGDVDGSTKIFVCIPNFEIRGKFRQWLRNHID